MLLYVIVCLLLHHIHRYYTFTIFSLERFTPVYTPIVCRMQGQNLKINEINV